MKNHSIFLWYSICMTNCIFCIDSESNRFKEISQERFIKECSNWRLLLQRDDKLISTKQAAGLLIAKRHETNVTDLEDGAKIELLSIIKESARLLCDKVGTTYTDQESVGFNQGLEAGQTIMHAHVHILPVSEEDPSELKLRAGIGGAFEALRKERLRC